MARDESVEYKCYVQLARILWGERNVFDGIALKDIEYSKTEYRIKGIRTVNEWLRFLFLFLKA